MFGLKHGKGAVVQNGQHIADTLQCVHCGRHWVPLKGSGTRRGWCSACSGVCCGNEACMVCIPYEARLEIMEGTRKQGDKYFNKLKYGVRL